MLRLQRRRFEQALLGRLILQPDWLTAKEAEAALMDLMKAGYATRHCQPPGPRGGRPSQVFAVSDARPPPPQKLPN
jgi:hypothetical protein